MLCGGIGGRAAASGSRRVWVRRRLEGEGPPAPAVVGAVMGVTGGPIGVLSGRGVVAVSGSEAFARPSEDPWVTSVRLRGVGAWEN